MHFYLGAFGSTGDVHPMIGIGRELRRRGHEVTVVTSGYFEPMARRAGLSFIDPIPDIDYVKSLSNPELWHPIRGSRVLFSLIGRTIEPTFRLARELFIPGETVFVGSSLTLGLRAAQEALGLPLATVHLSPCFFRSRRSGPRFYGLFRPEWLPDWVKDWQYRLIDDLAIDRHLGPALNAVLSQNKTPAARSILGEWLHSPELVLALFPPWLAAPQLDWPAQTVLTGFPLYDEREATEPSPELDEFLAAGSPPIVFTPGSANIQREAKKFFAAACDACRTLGRRGILLTRFADCLPSRLPDGVRHFDFVPFSYLLPRAAAIVHHGGVGTMAQGLAAGLPQLLMPMNFDQHDNAYRLRGLGCGTSLSPRRFTGPNVAEALNALLSSTTTAAACRRASTSIASSSPMETIYLALEQFAERTRSAAANGCPGKR